MKTVIIISKLLLGTILFGCVLVVVLNMVFPPKKVQALPPNIWTTIKTYHDSDSAQKHHESDFAKKHPSGWDNSDLMQTKAEWVPYTANTNGWNVSTKGQSRTIGDGSKMARTITLTASLKGNFKVVSIEQTKIIDSLQKALLLSQHMQDWYQKRIDLMFEWMLLPRDGSAMKEFHDTYIKLSDLMHNPPTK